MHAPSTFKGQAFHPELPGGQGPGRLHVEPNALRFVPHDAAVAPFELAYSGLTVRVGGLSDDTLLFAHPAAPEVTVFTSERGILEHPTLTGVEDLAQQVAAVRRGHRRHRRNFFGCLAVALVLVVGLIAAIGPLLAWVTDRIPPELEVRVGDAVFGQFEDDVLRDAALAADIDRLTEPLLAAVPESGYVFEVHVLNDDSVNAFALPGGHIVLHSGLILAAETPEEVLGVLGHEIAHVTERHSLRQIVDSAGLYVIVQTLLGDVSGLAGVLVDGSSEVLELSFSRDHELAADRVGWNYLLQADIDPRGMITFFETLGDSSAGGLESSLSFLSTHPASDERAELLRRELEALEGYEFQTLDFDLAAFQLRLREVMDGAPQESTE